MTSTSISYASDLQNVANAKELLKQVKDILDAVPQIRVEFENPTVEITKKHIVIDRVFPSEIRNFLK